MDPVGAYDLPPPRPGAAPVLDTTVSGSNIRPQPSQGPQWHLLTPAFVRVLRGHFSVQTRIEDPNLTGRVWTAQQDSPIIITSLAEWKPENANQRPAILVDRLEQNRDPGKEVIGNQFQGVRPGNYITFMQGAHVVHCLGGREGEADALAREVWRELNKFAPVLAPRLCLNRLRVRGIGKRTELTDHKQIYAVPIPIVYEYMEQWRVYPTDEAEITAILASPSFQ